MDIGDWKIPFPVNWDGVESVHAFSLWIFSTLPSQIFPGKFHSVFSFFNLMWDVWLQLRKHTLMEMHLAETVPKHQLWSPLTFNQPLIAAFHCKLGTFSNFTVACFLPGCLLSPHKNYVIFFLLISPLREARKNEKKRKKGFCCTKKLIILKKRN